jgi:Protein of unknown function (DUF1634)
MDEVAPAAPLHLEHWVHRTLLVGLVGSGLSMVTGLGIALIRRQDRPVGLPPPPGVVLRQALAGNGVALMELGLLALVATPILRVAVLALGWGLASDWRFAAVAVVVLGLLGVSLVLGVG